MHKPFAWKMNYIKRIVYLFERFSSVMNISILFWYFLGIVFSWKYSISLIFFFDIIHCRQVLFRECILNLCFFWYFYKKIVLLSIITTEIKLHLLIFYCSSTKVLSEFLFTTEIFFLVLSFGMLVWFEKFHFYSNSNLAMAKKNMDLNPAKLRLRPVRQIWNYFIKLKGILYYK
jgi:hypothetical protein